jgi:hypothetical protein
MQYFLISKQSKYNFIIPVLLLIGSFSIYSYNLGDQIPYGDEPLYFSWGAVNFDLIRDGDLNNPCLKNLADCGQLLFYREGLYEVSYTPVRNFLVGFSQYLTTGENEGDFYRWSCVWHACFQGGWPSSEEFASGRLFSAILGSLTIVVAFFIGKTLFNRTTGVFFSLILLFLSLWIVNSRLIMSEVYLYFFILLSTLFLLKSFNKESNYRMPFFILGAISFGIALNIKIIAFEIIIPISVMILFSDSFNEKLNLRFFKNKKNVLKVISLVLIFFVISAITFVATFPRYYDDPLNKMFAITEESREVGLFLSFPTLEKNYFYRMLVSSQVVLVPHLMDSYFYDLFPRESRLSLLDGELPLNYSTIPLTIFFFIGLAYIIRKIKTRNLNFSEFVLLVWFTSTFILIVLFNDFRPVERNYFSPFFPVILLASYGLFNFIKQIKNQKEKILFFMSFIITHSLYVIPQLDKIYFSTSEWWRSPIPVSSESSLTSPLVYVSTIIFVVIFVMISLRIKKDLQLTIVPDNKIELSKNNLSVRIKKDPKPTMIPDKKIELSKNNVPKSWDKSLKKFQKEYQLKPQLAEKIFNSEYLNLFEKICSNKKNVPNIVAFTLCSTLANLQKQGFDRNLLAQQEIIKSFDFLSEGKITKETMEIIFRMIMSGKAKTVEEVIQMSKEFLL